MNKLKSSKVMLVLSVLLVFILIGSASAADEAGNETVSTSNSDVDTVSQEVDSVDDSVSAAEPTGDLVVNDTSKHDEKLGASNDEDVLTASSVTTFTQLKNAIRNTGVSEINIMNDIKVTEVINFNHGNLVINGNGHVLDASGHNRIFMSDNYKNIVLKNIIFKNGYSNSAYASAVYLCHTSNSIIDNCSFLNNKFYYNDDNKYIAGTLTVHGTNIRINNCNFDGNEAKSRSHGITVETGSSNVNITNCNFTNGKYIASSNGVPMAVYLKGVNTLVDNCYFYNNDRGVYFSQHGYDNIINNCTFVNNHIPSGDFGAAVIYGGFNCRIVNSIFIDNIAGDGGAIYSTDKAESSSISNCTFIHNSANNHGGAVYFTATNCIMDNCTFINNSAVSAGAVKFGGTGNNMTNCSFINNTASEEGGAVQFMGDNCTMINCTYVNNTATVDGGGLCSQATGSVIDGCSFSKNNASTGPDFYGHGNPITFRNMFFTSLWLTNSNFTTSDSYNHTLIYGFGTSWDQPARWDENVSSFLKKNTHCTIYLVGTINNLTHNVLNISNLDIVGESPLNPNASYIDLSGWNSSGFIVNASEITFTKLTFKNANLSDGNGGAIRILSNATVIDSCTFINNTAVNGSAVCFESGIVFLIRNSTFIDNHAVNGTVYMHKDAESTMIYSSTFRNNTAYLGGGVFYAGPVWYYIDGATFQKFSGNNATYNATRVVNGSSVIVSAYNDNGTNIFTGFAPNETDRARLCIDTVYVALIGRDGNPHTGDNRSDPTDFDTALSMVAPNGKIIFVNSTETWNMYDWYSKQNYINYKYNVTIIGNDTRLVGFKFTNGVYAYDVSLSGFNISNDDGCVVWQARDGTVTNCSFTSENTVAFIVEGENMIITDSSFINNANGALKVDNVGLMLINCTFDNNTLQSSSGRGSHIFMTGNANNTVIINSTFTNGTNTGVVVNATGVRIVGSNFTDNKGDYGAALFLLAGDLVLTDDTFVRNVATNNGGALYLSKGKVLAFTDNTFVNNTAGINGGAVWMGIPLNMVDSIFIGNTANSSSGAIRANNNLTAVNCDFINNNAVAGGAIAAPQNYILLFESCDFENNTANTNGGAITTPSITVVKDSNFTNNSANKGGAIYTTNNITIAGSKFIGNNASQYGGALYALSNATVLGCEFNNNTAGINGGALFLNGTNNKVSNTLFKANTAINGSAIYLSSGKNLTLNKVNVEENTYTDFKSHTYGSIYIVGKDTFKYKDLDLVGLNDVYDGGIYLKTIYVNNTGDQSSYGRTPDEATTLTHALDYLIEGGRIIFTTDYLISTETLNLNNRTIIFVGNRTKLNREGKYLFIIVKNL